jgi:hypothetical protein
MINLDKIINVLGNFKGRTCNIPDGNKFTQRTSYQMKVNELEKLVENDMSELEEYVDRTMNITSQKRNKSTQQQERNKNTILSLENNSIIFTDGEIINIPHMLKPIFQGLDKNDYYLYGIKNNESFYNSLVLLTQKDYIIKTKSEKSGSITSFRRELELKLEINFANFDYKELKLNKADLITLLNIGKEVNNGIKLVASDFIKENVCVININTKSYHYFEAFDLIDDNMDFLIIIQINDYYSPIMNTDGKHTFQQNVLTYINQNFEKEINSSIKRIKKNSNKVLDLENTALQLKALSSYKLKDLQDLAANNSINIMKEDNKGKEKNKTKTELYNELKVL